MLRAIRAAARALPPRLPYPVAPFFTTAAAFDGTALKAFLEDCRRVRAKPPSLDERISAAQRLITSNQSVCPGDPFSSAEFYAKLGCWYGDLEKTTEQRAADYQAITYYEQALTTIDYDEGTKNSIYGSLIRLYEHYGETDPSLGAKLAKVYPLFKMEVCGEGDSGPLYKSYFRTPSDSVHSSPHLS